MTSQAAWHAVADFWPRADTSRFVRVSNIDFHVQVGGAGEDVLLLHGAGASAHSFSGLAARLSARHRVIAPDLPGQGFSTLLPLEAVGLAPFAVYLRELMTALEATPRWIIGHSAGAALAAQYALDAETLPKGLLCINAAFNPFGSLAAPLLKQPVCEWGIGLNKSKGKRYTLLMMCLVCLILLSKTKKNLSSYCSSSGIMKPLLSGHN